MSKRRSLSQRKIQRPQGEKAKPGARNLKVKDVEVTYRRVKVGLKKKTRRVLQISVPQGTNITHTQSNMLAFRLAAGRHPRPDCIVYDKDGKPIATINADTRERRPWPASS